MPIAELDEAFRLIAAHPEATDLVGKRTPALIEKAEAALGLRFPPTYRRFLTEFGAGRVGSEEFFGVTDDDFEDSRVPDAVWLTLDERRTAGLPPSLIVIGDSGDDFWLAIDTSKDAPDAEHPVVAWPMGFPAERAEAEVVAKDFGEYLLSRTNGALRRLAKRKSTRTKWG